MTILETFFNPKQARRRPITAAKKKGKKGKGKKNSKA